MTESLNIQSSSQWKFLIGEDSIFLVISRYLLTLVTSEGGGLIPPPYGFLLFSRKFFPATYDETLCKFLLCTYEDSHNSFWSKILSREHVEYVKVAWAENVNFPDCNFRVLRGIFWGVSLKQKLLKIEKYQGRWPFFLDLSIFRVKKCKKRISHKN